MPCRCCGASRPSKGYDANTLEKSINANLKEAARLIKSKNADNQYEDIDDWKRGWIQAFDHHLNGCPEGNNK